MLRIEVRTILLAALLGLATFESARAVPARPIPHDAIQPDGTAIKLQLRGDEHFHWTEDLNGYTVVTDGGWYYYAERDGTGNLKASSLAVGKASPADAGLSPHLMPSRERIAQAKAEHALDGPAEAGAGIQPLGTVKQLMVLMRFSNHAARPLRTQGDYDILMNAVGGHPTIAPIGSVRDMYHENSYDQFTLNSTVTAWVPLLQTEQYYAANQSGLGATFKEAIIGALNALDPVLDFSQYDADHDGFVDAIGFVHSGYGAENGGTDQYGTPSEQRIWSHKGSIATWTSAEGVKVSPYYVNPGMRGTSGTEITDIGVFIHESGHFFGLPDLYDTDDSPGNGVGSWCMMANPWSWDNTGMNPPHFSSWCKINMGWVTPTVITAPGNYSLGTWALTPSVYRINQGYPANEYLLIENRQPVGSEWNMPQGGLIVYHIDDITNHNNEGYPGQQGWPENGNHYRVAVLQADGGYDLERGLNRGGAADPFRSGGVNALRPDTSPDTDAYQGGRVRYTGNAITNISAPASTMNFTVGFGDPLRVDTAAKVWWAFDSAGPEGGPFSPAARTFTLKNASSSSGITANITSIEPWLGISASSVGLGASATGNVTLNVLPSASLLPPGMYPATASIRNAGTNFEYDVDARLHVSTVIASFPMNTNPNWTRTGLWNFGVPTGNGGDPNSGKTGTNVYGYNLQGPYANNLGEETLTTAPINCSAHSRVVLQFWRWLSVQAFPFDRARVQVSADGVTFNDVWVHSGATINDGQWVEHVADISAYAAGQPTVYVRWVMGKTNADTQFGGWNIDDVTLWGVPSDDQVIASFPLDTNPQWTTEGAWAWGIPMGAGGDPFTGKTNAYVYGFNLQGAYLDNIPERSLTSIAINCSGYSNVHLKFWRWLGVEESIYDHARVQASNDGVNFSDVWVHNGPTIEDTQWTLQSYDISGIADNQPTVYLRWVMGTADEFLTFSGWNIDDISLVGSAGAPSNVVWVDFGHAGAQKGTEALPYKSAIAGVSRGEPGQTVRFKGNSSDTASPEILVLQKPLRLEAVGGDVQIGSN